MKSIQLDTSLISSALAPFRTSDACSPSQVRDSLEFCNSLIGADSIAYDGQVRKWTEDRLGPAISSVVEQLSDSAASDCFQTLFSPILLDDSRQKTVLFEAVTQATSFLDEVCRNASALGSYLRGSGPTEPENHLFPHLVSKEQPSDDCLESLLSNKNITGRRFYWAALSHEETRRRLGAAYIAGLLNPSVISILFTSFRVYFAYSRADDRGGEKHVYIPSAERRCLIRHIFELVPEVSEDLHRPIAQEDFVKRLIRAWDATNNEVATFRPTAYPGFVSLAVRYFKPTDRESFLRACLFAKELDVVSRIRTLEHQLDSVAGSGGSAEGVIAQAVDLYAKYACGSDPRAEARKSLLLSWILAVFAFLPPNLATIATVVDLIKGTSEHLKQWESQRGRTAMLLARDLMPCILPDKDVAAAVKRIFGSVPTG